MDSRFMIYLKIKVRFTTFYRPHIEKTHFTQISFTNAVN